MIFGPAVLSRIPRFGPVPPLIGPPTPGGLDDLLFRALNLAGTNAAVDLLMVAVTMLGGTYIIGLLAVPLWVRGHREATFDFLVLLGITVAITTLLQILLGRPRPCDVPSDYHTVPWGYECPVFPSFPSGHASRAFAVAAFVGIRFRWRLGGAAIVFATFVGISRIYLGVHWPSDVLAGALLGIGLTLAYEATTRRLPTYERIRQRLVEAIPHFPRRSA